MHGDAAQCKNCGGELTYRREASTQGYYCSNCDWAVVTTYVPEIFKDLTEYVVGIQGGDCDDHDQLRVVAHLSGKNMLAAREILQAPSSILLKDTAEKVRAAKMMLEGVGLSVNISPPFPW